MDIRILTVKLIGQCFFTIYFAQIIIQVYFKFSNNNKYLYFKSFVLTSFIMNILSEINIESIEHTYTYSQTN